MRKARMQVGIQVGRFGLVGLLLVATAGAARAQDATPVAATSAAPAAHKRRLQLGVTFLPMSLGRFKSVYGGMPSDLDAAFAPGVAVSLGYEVVRGLTVGIAPQVLFNVKPKEDPITTDPAASTELDAMVRVAYAYPLTDTIALYGAVLPGFSLIKPKVGDPAKGFVFGFDVGAIMNMTARTFVTLGGGYQWGLQSRTDTSEMMENGMTVVTTVTTDVKTEYYRVALGIGWRL